jgi:hypothetical protein
MDDIIVLGSSPEACLRDACATLALLRAWGFIVNTEKTSLVPSPCVRFLGFDIILLMDRVLVSWPREKATRVLLDAWSNAAAGVSSPRVLSALCGRVNFLRVIFPLAGALVRSLDYVHRGARHWDLPLTLSASVVHDLRVLAALCADLSCSWWVLLFSPGPSPVDLEVDASATGWGARLLSSTSPREFYGLFTPAVCKTSSAVRETIGASRALLASLSSLFVSDLHLVTIRVVCDNTSVSAVFRRGRCPFAAAAAIRELLHPLISLAHCVVIIPMWRSRVTLTRADTLSRLAAADRTLSILSVGPALIQRFRLVRDLFAIRENALCARFVSPYPDALAEACDALSFPWVDGDYAFPPFVLAHRALHHLIDSCVLAGHCLRAVVIVPAHVPLPDHPLVSLRFESIFSGVLAPPGFNDVSLTLPLNIVFAHRRMCTIHPNVDIPPSPHHSTLVAGPASALVSHPRVEGGC